MTMAAVLDILSSPLRRVITQVLQSYLARYIKNISLEGGRMLCIALVMRYTLCVVDF